MMCVPLIAMQNRHKVIYNSSEFMPLQTNRSMKKHQLEKSCKGRKEISDEMTQR